MTTRALEVSATLPAAFGEAALAALAAADPDWLKQMRAEALARAEATAFPTLNDEAWRRTNPSRFRLDSFRLPKAGVSASPQGAIGAVAAANLPELREALLVTVDGLVAHHDASAKLSEAGVIFGDFASAARTHGEAMKKDLFHGAAMETLDRWSALNAAFATSGAYIRIPKNTVVEQPLVVLHHQQGAGRAAFLHTVLHVEAGASVTVLEVTSGTDDAAGLVHSAVDVIAEAGSNVHYLRMQELGVKSLHLSRERLYAHRDAQVNWSWGALGSAMAKSDMEANLLGEGIHAMISGFYHGEGTQHLDHHTFQNHEKGNTVSDLLYKGSLLGRARSVYMGLIKIHKDAQRSDAYQANRNLLLSSTARTDSIPSLEIEANDVRCTHGATMGQIDEEQLFYLRARGITRAEAVRLIVEGFYEPVFDRIGSETLRSYARARLERRVKV